MVRNASIDALLRGSAAGVGGSGRTTRLGGALLTIEVAGTVVLLIVAGALTASFLNLRGANLGFDREGVLTAFVNASRARYPDAEARRRFFRNVLRRALGANRSRVLAQLLRSTLACVLTGLCIGTFLAVAAGRSLHLALFETTLANPWIGVAVASLILGVSLVACIGPAARVHRLDVGAMLRE